MRSDFYEDRRYCAHYVRFLASPGRAFCIHCNDPVTLFSDADRASFQRSLGGRRFPDERREWADDDGSGGPPPPRPRRRSA